MFKTGIYTLEQLKNPKKLKTIFGNDKKISITLYNELIQKNYDNELAEKILLNFTDARGAFKRTYSNRFDEFDKIALEIIKDRFSTDESLVFHDAAVSDGRTACDFFLKLGVCYPKINYYASDYDPYIYVIEEDGIKLVVNSKSIPLEILYPPFVLNLTNIHFGYRYIINSFIAFFLRHTTAKQILLKYHKKLLIPQEYLLFAPQAIALDNNNSQFQLKQYNLLEKYPVPQSLNAVRAMNILNPGYFKPEEFKIIVSHIFDSLIEQGIFITGSNQDSTSPVLGNIFLKEKNRFKKLYNSGGGSSIEKIIMDHNNYP